MTEIEEDFNLVLDSAVDEALQSVFYNSKSLDTVDLSVYWPSWCPLVRSSCLYQRAGRNPCKLRLCNVIVSRRGSNDPTERIFEGVGRADSNPWRSDSANSRHSASQFICRFVNNHSSVAQRRLTLMKLSRQSPICLVASLKSRKRLRIRRN